MEMVQRRFCIAQLAQRDIARQPFQIGIIAAAGQEMLRGHAIGAARIALAHLLAGQSAAPVGPLIGIAQSPRADRAFEQKIARAVIKILADAPAEAVIGKTAGGKTFFRHGGDQGIDALVIGLKRDPSGGDGAGIGAGQRQHPPRVRRQARAQHRGGAAIVVCGKDRRVKRDEAGVFVGCHRQRPPGAHGFVPCRRGPPRPVKRRDQRKAAGAGLGNMALEKGDDVIPRHAVKHRLATLAQIGQARPVGVSRQEGAVFGKAALPVAQPFPIDDRGRKRPGSAGRGHRPGPVAPVGCGKGRAQLSGILGASGRKGGKCKG